MKKVFQMFGVILAVIAILPIFPIDALAEKPRPIILGFTADPLDSLIKYGSPPIGRVKLVQQIILGHADKNKPRYQAGEMNWQVYESKHFKLYSYNDGKEALVDWYLEVLERAYEKDSLRFGVSTFEEKIPVIIYNSRQDFEETNVIREFIPKSLGGFTEIMDKKRMVLPFDGYKEAMRHVLEHELTHSFEVEMLKKNVFSAPLWFIEGVAEHNSRSWDAEAELIVKDAYFNSLLPSLENDDFAYEYLVYKYGELASNYLYDNCKNDKIKDPIKEIFLETKKGSFKAFERALPKVCGGLTLKKLDQALKGEMAKRFESSKDKEAIYPKAQLLAKGSLLLGASNYFFVTQSGKFGRDEIYLNYRKDNGVEIVSEKLAEGGRYEVQSLSQQAKISGNKAGFVVQKGFNDAIVIQEFRLDGKEKLKLGNREEYSWKEIREISSFVFMSSSSLAFIGKNGNFGQICLFNMETKELKFLTSGQNSYNGLTYSPALKALVTAIETDTAGGKIKLNLASIDIKTGKIKKLMLGSDNEMSPDFSPDGRSILFVSDKGLTYNIYTYNFEDRMITQLTDSRSGAFHPKWLSESAIAFNSFSKAEMDVYAMPLPKAKSPEIKKVKDVSENSKRESQLDRLLKEKIKGWEDYEVIQKVFSSDNKTAVVAVNLGVSFEGKVKKKSPIAFFAANLENGSTRQFSIEKIKKVENLVGIEILHGSNALIGYKGRTGDTERQWVKWILYNWDSQKMEKITRPAKQAKNGKFWEKSQDISKDGRYLALKKSGKIKLLDTAENKIVWESREKGIVGLKFPSSGIVTVLRENKPAKTFDFETLAVASSSAVSAYSLPASSLGGKNSKIFDWAISPDSKKIALAVEHRKSRGFLRKSVRTYDLRLIDVLQNKTEIVADKLARTTELGFNKKELKAGGVNAFGNTYAYSVTSSSKTIACGDEPVFVSTRIAKPPELVNIPLTFKPERIVKRKDAKPPYRFPKVTSGYIQGGMMWINSGKPNFSTAFSMYGSDYLDDRVYGLNVAMYNQYGIAQFAYRDVPSGQTFGFQYWNMGEDRKNLTASYSKNIFLNKFLNWDVTVAEEYSESKEYPWYKYEFKVRDPLKTRLGTTFSLDTTVWNHHGPHSGNMFFAGTEAVVDSKARFTSMDVSVEGRNYLPITERSGLAFRLASGKSVGPEPTIFLMGGNKAFRGMPFLDVGGNNYVLASADLRVPLFDFVVAMPSGPSKYLLFPFMAFVDLQSGVYFDAGSAWYNKGQAPYGEKESLTIDYSAGYFLNVPTFFGLTFRFSQGVSGEKGSSFWIGYNW